MYQVEDRAIVCLFVYTFDDEMTEARLQALTYLLERNMMAEYGHTATSYTFTKFSSGPHSSSLQDDIESLVEDDCLYKQQVSDSFGARYMIDYRSKVEDLLETVPSEVRSQVHRLCEQYEHSFADVIERVNSFDEVATADKYTVVSFDSV